MGDAESGSMRPHEKNTQILVLGVAVLLALTAVLVRMMGVQTPAASEPDLINQPFAGWNLIATPVSAARAGEEFSYSTVWRWRSNEPSSDGERSEFDASELTMVKVHARHHFGLSLEQMTATVPGLQLKGVREHTISDGPAKGTVIALGTLDDVPTLQTCVVESRKQRAMAHISADVLTQAVEGLRIRDWRNHAYILLGVQPNVRWECLLVSIQAKSATQELLQAKWHLLFAALRERD
ncbi:MAG: hypothetical protein Q8S92_15640 [Hydrogenophaga sp.]|uniref:hypothetical protein n=1 Tax=Hydrogenophaga sp. TaxID=1904254 RepID=UPI0027374AC1|nr:hypothetical protein [Hydrogenophaga sp.]MDP3350422.1 hypothetical protein [Hydrogenophaga sp.]